MVHKIAFGGKMGVGKDFAVEYLMNKYSGNKLSFAKPLYDILHFAQKTCGFREEKDRQFLQFIGTDWARQKNPDIWVEKLQESVVPDENCFISDLRFPNELHSLKKNGWICVKIIRKHQENREGTGSVNHSSESLFESIQNSEWDYIIENNGSPDDFYTKLEEIISTSFSI